MLSLLLTLKMHRTIMAKTTAPGWLSKVHCATFSEEDLKQSSQTPECSDAIMKKLIILRPIKHLLDTFVKTLDKIITNAWCMTAIKNFHNTRFTVNFIVPAARTKTPSIDAFRGLWRENWLCARPPRLIPAVQQQPCLRFCILSHSAVDAPSRDELPGLCGEKSNHVLVHRFTHLPYDNNHVYTLTPYHILPSTLRHRLASLRPLYGVLQPCSLYPCAPMPLLQTLQCHTVCTSSVLPPWRRLFIPLSDVM